MFGLLMEVWSACIQVIVLHSNVGDSWLGRLDHEILYI